MSSAWFSTLIDLLGERYHDALVWALTPLRRRVGIALVLALTVAALWRASRGIRIDPPTANDVVVTVRGDDAASVAGKTRHIADEVARLAGVRTVRIERGSGAGAPWRVTATIDARSRDSAPSRIQALLAAIPSSEGDAVDVGGSILREQKIVTRVGIVATAGLIALAGLIAFSFRTLTVALSVLAALFIALAGAFVPFILRATVITRWTLVAASVAAATAIHQAIVVLAEARRRVLLGDGIRAALIGAARARFRTALALVGIAFVVAIALLLAGAPRSAVASLLLAVVAGVAGVLFVVPAVHEDLVAISSRRRARRAVRRAWRRVIGDA